MGSWKITNPRFPSKKAHSHPRPHLYNQQRMFEIPHISVNIYILPLSHLKFTYDEEKERKKKRVNYVLEKKKQKVKKKKNH